MSWTAEDVALREAAAALEPTRQQIARGQQAVEERVAREGMPLLDEWLGLLRARPLANGGLALAAALSLLLTTPLGALLRALLSARGA